jgi:uncharacterized protein (UPF0332 family)
MSHADNKVKWCLNKAIKELEEGKPHRGLVKTEPNDEKATNHFTKAQHNLNAAKFFHENNYSDWSASAFFYSIYHCFLGIILKHGYESRNQECTLACLQTLIEQKVIQFDEKYIKMLEIAKSKEIDQSVIETREKFQYGTEMKLQEHEFKNLQSVCEDVLEKTEDIIKIEH